MPKVLRLALREYKTAVKTKGFIIGLVVAPIFMGGGAIGMALLKDHVDVSDRRIAVVDRTGVLLNTLVEAAELRNSGEIHDEESSEQVRPAYLIEESEWEEADAAELRLELSEKVRNGQLHAFVEIESGVIHPNDDGYSRISYYAENAAMDETRGWVDRLLNNRLRQIRLSESGIEESRVEELLYWNRVQGMGLVSVDADTGEVQEAKRSSEGEAVGVPAIMVFLMFLMIMMSAMPLLSAVMEEKTQRIAEVLLGSVSPFEFMMGKILGGVGVSLTGSLVYVLGGIIAARRLDVGEFVPYHVLPWFFVYMIGAIFMIGSVLAALGSACENAKDAQSLTFPAMLPLMLPMFVLAPVLKQPDSTFATWLSLFPPCTPLLMLLRQSTPAGVPSWQPWVGLVGVILTALLAIWAGGRIFRVAILMQGQPPKLSLLIRWALRG